MDNSTITANNETVFFSWYDYILCLLMLALSALIGIYFGFFAKQKQNNVTQYLHGGKQMGVLPISLSLVASAVSGTTMLGVPTDVYRFGTTYIFSVIGCMGVTYVAYKVYVPVFFKLQLISTYEYLELRFNKPMRVLGSAMFTINTILHMPMLIYAPALAVAQATGAHVFTICWMVSLVCVFYTTLGGLKAVVWTDALQFILMVGAIVLVLFMGVSAVGGVGEVFRRASEGERLSYNFEFDPTKRDTVWALLIAIQFGNLGYIAIGQACVQKYLALPDMSSIKTAMINFFIGASIISIVSIVTGIIIYAKYADCDPISNGKIEKHDQILPYFIMEISQKMPGLGGLYIAGLISAALSSLSALINALCGTIYEDFISPFMPKDTSQKTASNILKLLAIIIGTIGTGLVLLFEKLGTTILPLQFSLTGIATGALIGAFTLGMLIPMANSKGAIAGTISSIIIMGVIIFMSQLYQYQGLIHHETKPVSVHGCPDFRNATLAVVPYSTITESDTNDSEQKPMFIFLISHWYFSMIGIFIAMIVGIPTSYFTRSKTDKLVSKDLIAPVMHWCMKIESQDNLYLSVDKALEVVYNDDFDQQTTQDKMAMNNK